MRKTQFLAFWGLAAIIGAGCGHKEAEVEHKEPRRISAQTLMLTESTSPLIYEASGTLQPILRADLSSKIMAKVLAVKVRPGDSVRRGQLLISLDSRDLAASAAMARAGLTASQAAVDTAKTAEALEAKTSQARIAQADAQVVQAKAALAAARAKLSLALAGPRTQEKSQAKFAVQQAQSSLTLAEKELARTKKLVEDGALAARELDLAQNAYDLAKASYDSAVAAENIAQEGTRTQDIQAAREGVAQAEGAVKMAEAGLVQAKAAALQVSVRRQGIVQARAQAGQSSAAVQNASVALSYSNILAPFDGVVVERAADPGVMAGPGMPLLTVESRDLRLEAKIPESKVKSLEIGKEVDVVFDVLDGFSIRASLTELTPKGDPQSHSFVAKFLVGSAAGLKSGMYGRAQIPVGSDRGIWIPETSAWERDGLTYVYVANSDGIVRLRIVTLGAKNGGQALVLSGLAKGERIVLGGKDKAADGDKVEGL